MPSSHLALRQTARDEIKDFRYSVFRAIKQIATQESVNDIQKLIELFPDEEWMKWELIRAKDLARQAAWEPPSPVDLMKLASNKEIRLVRDANELQQLIIESLDRLQQKLKYQVTPSIRYLWDNIAKDSYKPKSEEDFSDYVKLHLDDDLVNRGIIANREVQIRRGIGENPGQRTDIYVEAITKQNSSYDSVTVVIEVKGCWNQGVDTAMETQLKDRYMLNNTLKCGIYLVGWFDSPKWHVSDINKKRCQRRNFEGARTFFTDQAQELSDEQFHIRAVVLDTSF